MKKCLSIPFILTCLMYNTSIRPMDDQRQVKVRNVLKGMLEQFGQDIDPYAFGCACSNAIHQITKYKSIIMDDHALKLEAKYVVTLLRDGFKKPGVYGITNPQSRIFLQGGISKLEAALNDEPVETNIPHLELGTGRNLTQIFENLGNISGS